MSRHARRILCRVGFLTFCLLPTLLVVGWIINARVIQGAPSPAEEALARPAAEAELSRLLGLTVTLESLSYTQENVTLLEGVTLADPETGRRIAAVPSLEMARTEGGIVLVATRPEIDADHWGALWESLHDRVLRQRGEQVGPVQFIARQVTIASQNSGAAPTLTDVDARLSPGQAAIDFRLAGVEMANPAQFRAARDRSASPPVTRWELHTGEADFPCVLVADYVPWLSHLGDRCRFNGSLWAEETAAGWQGEVTGRFAGIDLDRLVTSQFPHKLSGEANATFSRLAFTEGRIRHASGWLEAGPGTIGRSLIQAAVDAFAWRPTDRLREPSSTLSRYGRMAVGFEIDDVGLRLSGACDPEGAALVLEDDPEARLLDRRTHVAPIVSLVRMLAPVSEVQVSATQETDALLRVLPLPPIKRPEPPADAAPQARVR